MSGTHSRTESSIGVKKGTTSTSSVRSSKEDALDEPAFERLYRGARRLDCDVRRLEAEFIVLVGGRLGLRAGELAHFRADWVNARQQTIEIPGHLRCRKGRDGGMCGYCSDRASKIIANNDGVDESDAPAIMWSPKTEAGARSVPFGFSARIELVVEDFLDELGDYPHSKASVNRRVNTAAEHARGIDVDDVYPHALRASAASYHASHGLSEGPMKAMFGWEHLETAESYLNMDGRATVKAVTAAHNH